MTNTEIEQQLLAFLAFCGKKEVYLAGNVFQIFLGTYELRPMAEEDWPKVIQDYLIQRANATPSNGDY